MINNLLKTGITTIIVIVFSILSAYSTNYYVNATTGDNSYSGLSTTQAKKTIQAAANLTNPGDTVFIMNGTYNSINGTLLNITRSGSATQYITYKAYQNNTPKLTASKNVWNCVSVNANYIVIDGLELEGNNANITYDSAYKCYLDYMAGSRDWARIANYNTNGLTVGGPKLESKLPHHVIIRNCKIHDFPGGGLNAIQADYVTFEYNQVYNNAHYMMYGGSGISILCPFNYDSLTTYKNIIRGNICNNNKTTIPWIGLTPPRLSDGNGIIIDINRTPYPGGVDTRTGEYIGRTLVENNISFNNGGSGIHAYEANHVDIINNTAYHNGVMVGYADIFANTATDVKIINNIMYARTGGKCNSNNNNTNVIYDYNLYYNGTTDIQGPHDIVADPQFINLTTDRNLANFNLKNISPAINGGSNISGQYSLTDITRKARPSGSKPEMGAYEFTAGSTAQTITFNAIPAKTLGDADFNPGATASSGLPVIYRSSNTAVAKIINGLVQLVGIGSCTITATQGGNATYAQAPDVSQVLTVNGGSFANLIGNSTFNTNTAGWSFNAYNGASGSADTITKTGYNGKAYKTTITNGGTANWHIQLSYPVPLTKDKTYLVKFKASADANRTIDVAFQGTTNYYLSPSASLTTTPKTFTYTFTATATDATAKLKFFLGSSTTTSAVYIDDVEVSVVPSPEINIKQGSNNIANKDTYNFGNSAVNNTITTTFTIENIGDLSLNLLSATRITLTGKGFILVTDASPVIFAGQSTTFQIKFQPDTTGNHSATINILNNDANENPYTITLSGTGIKADQTITFPSIPTKKVGDADFNPGATSSSGLPVTYTSSDTTVATIINGKIHIKKIGTSTITAIQNGNNLYNAATSVTQLLTVTSITDINISQDEKNNIQVYPTPAKNIIYIKNSLSNTQFNLFNTSGALVLSETLNNTNTIIDISKLKNGIYFYLLENNKFSKTGKIIKTE